MRLNKIKISGFKSFVDPTTISFPSNLIGIVGPNGCGKSNTIDAVRWVMGESSAKHLRGASMSDVIFNGSTSRKPVGQANIELVFDNTDNSAGGQYATYNEISVKRVMSRDGQSNYYLNGSKCRKRDITDLFLGTGLGPRSYAIIEQGMISRIIDAKPEELRVYIEEAAGISKYKERRKETESRLKNTKENLSRLADLREEVDKQIDKLQRQARVAEKYKRLRHEERKVKSQLLVVKLRKLRQQLKSLESEISARQTELESYIANQRSAEKTIEQTREEYATKTEEFNVVQGLFYSLGSDIAKIEQTIQHRKTLKSRHEDDFIQIKSSIQQSNEQRELEIQRLEEAQEKLIDIEPLFEETKLKEDEFSEHLDLINDEWQKWQQDWEDFNRTASVPVQKAQAERIKIDLLEKQIIQSNNRLERLVSEQQNISVDEVILEIENLTEQEMIFGERVEELQHLLQDCHTEITSIRQQNREKTIEQERLKNQLQQHRGRLSSLEALQQAALGKDKGKASNWLKDNGLDASERLAEVISVEHGWEQAVEVVLGKSIEAVCTEGIAKITSSLHSLVDSSIILLEKDNRGEEAKPSISATKLASYVTAPWSIGDFIGSVYAVDTLDQALALRDDLSVHESVVSRDGIWIGKGWVRISREKQATSGIISREVDIKELKDNILAQESIVNSVSQVIEQGRERLQELEAKRENLQTEVNEQHRQVSAISARLGGKKIRLEQMQGRLNRIEIDIVENNKQIERNDADLIIAQNELFEALAQSEDIENQRETKENYRDELKNKLNEVQQLVRECRDKSHKYALELQSINHSKTTIEKNIERILSQLAQFSEKQNVIEIALNEFENPSENLATDLENLLQDRINVEENLTDARQRLSDVDQEIRNSEQLRVSSEQKSQEIRAALELLRINLQEVKVHRQTYDEQMSETGQLFDDIDKDLPEDASEDEWKVSLEDLILKIQRLGSINLAAIEEYKEEYERKCYLDNQNKDLEEALETLENAIKKIDRETRTRFKDTFDKVNAGLQRMFPRLFGGGQGYLELTGADLLDTGVAVMARPPGKKISNIQLMSGGEKALTAVALVFSIFELNPAPFCMLDEVDAPLDEANVGRFGQLVKEMSATVQFIFITHNKATMEISTHLMGVTMHEPGVSRIVSVDVDEAIELTGVV